MKNILNEKEHWRCTKYICWLLVAGYQLPQHQPQSHVRKIPKHVSLFEITFVRFEADAPFVHIYFLYNFSFSFSIAGLLNLRLPFRSFSTISLYFPGLYKWAIDTRADIVKINNNYFGAGPKDEEQARRREIERQIQ